MRSKRARILSAVLLGSALSLAAAAPAAAGGWHYGGYHHGGWRHHRHSTIFLGFNYGFPIYRPAPVYYAPYYAPPPRVVYVERPPAAPPCRRFDGDATIDDSGQPFYGVACLLSDGRWHIAN